MVWARKAIFCFLVILIASTYIRAEILYDVIIFEPQGDSFATSAESINNEGIIVGKSEYDTEGWQHSEATLFNSNNPSEQINLQGNNYGSSEALSISSNGLIAGHYSSGGKYATLFDATGGGDNTVFQNLHHCSSVNANSQIAGAFNDQAYVYDPISGIKELGGIGGDYSVANKINDQGDIVGYSYIDYLGSPSRATLFDPTGLGNNMDLGTLGGSSSIATDINDLGQIIGSANVLSQDWHATIFDPSGNGGNIDLGYGEAHAINNSGMIVGEYNTSESGCGYDWSAMLFDSSGNGNNIDLNTVIDPDLGIHLWSARDINDNGCIVGWAFIDNQSYRNSRAFLLVPVPEPCTLALLAIGGLALRKIRI